MALKTPRMAGVSKVWGAACFKLSVELRGDKKAERLIVQDEQDEQGAMSRVEPDTGDWSLPLTS